MTESDIIRRVVKTMFGGRRIITEDFRRCLTHSERALGGTVTPDMVLPVVQALVCSFGAPFDGIVIEMHRDNPFALLINFDQAVEMTVDLGETP